MLTNSRKVVATFFRSTGPSQQREAVWSRRYAQHALTEKLGGVE